MAEPARLERLNALLAVARADAPFQRSRLGHHVALEDLEELGGLPFTRKADLLADQRAHPPFGTNLPFGPDRYTHLNQTSGTTGEPLRVLDTDADWRWWARCIGRALRAAGVGPADRVALAFSFGPHVQFWASYAGVQEVGALAVPLGGMGSVQRLAAIGDHGATVLLATPSYAAHLARVAAAEGLGDALGTVTRVVCTGEPGASLPALRDQLEAAWGARVHDHAGASEAGSFALPCDAGGGLHLNEDEFVFELVDPHGDGPAPAGELAELVVTALGRVGFPVLRYRTGDVVQPAPGPCPAGHPGRWLPGGILGRTDDMVVVRGMNVFPSAIEEVLRESRGLGEFRITFSRDPEAMDEVKVEAELGDPSEARQIQERLRQRLGLRVRIVPLKAGVLPRRRLKGRRVEDLRAGDAGVTAVPVARRSASEQVADDIRAHVRREALAPGDRLGREEDLARRFGVSRPTLREALRLLASAHLVRATKGPGGGIFVEATAEQGMARTVSAGVASLLAADAVDLDELLEARTLAEVPLAGLAARRATPAQLAALRALLDEAEAVGDDPERLAAIDRELHRGVTAAAGNRLAVASTGWVVDVLQPVLEARLRPAVVDATLLEQHRDLLAALERGDAPAAERAMREHLLYLRDVLTVVQELEGDRSDTSVER